MSEAPERIWREPDIWFPECEKQYDRIEELEAKLATATGALVQVAGQKTYADDPGAIARTTLAKLKGDN
jgi:hypothetical protein